MRYDKLVTFVTLNREYDPDSGEYIDTKEESRKRANVTETGAERQQIEYGNVRNDRLTIRLQIAYGGRIDRIIYNGEEYVPTRYMTLSGGRQAIEVERWAAT